MQEQLPVDENIYVGHKLGTLIKEKHFEDILSDLDISYMDWFRKKCGIYFLENSWSPDYK